MKATVIFAALAASFISLAETVVDVTGKGAEKITVSVDVSGAKSFSDSLKRNLSLSGGFQLVKPGVQSAVKVSGTVGVGVKAEGKGKSLTLPSRASDDKSARREARRLADKMVETYLGAKGFASDPFVFVSKKGLVSELCEGYPDGFDMRQLTSAGKAVVGPRWNGTSSVFYTAIANAGPQIYQYDMATGESFCKWSFRGLSTGAAVSPDGRKVAVILSIHGNPELYVIDIAANTWKRLTNTPFASEGQPSWSPDGSKIAYVSDESRRPHLYVVEVATKKKTRITSSGQQNVDPDWGPDGRIVFISKRDGAGKIAIVDPAQGASSIKIVDVDGTWEHPSWSRDGRHVVATSGDRIFIVDTFPKSEGGEKPRQALNTPGKWITPSWRRQ